MRLQDAERLVKEKLKEHGLTGVRFSWDNAKRRLGQWRPRENTISLSRSMVKLNQQDRVLNTILHEIAHVLVGIEHGHDEVWREKAMTIGCDGNRCANQSDTLTLVKPEPNYIGVCVNGHQARRFKLTARAKRIACGECCRKLAFGRWDERFLFRWTRT